MLGFALERSGVAARLLLVSLVDGGAETALGAVAAHACRAWGTRLASEVGALGGAVAVRQGRRCHLVGAGIEARTEPQRTLGPPEVCCHGHAGGIRRWVMAQRGGDVEVAARVAGVLRAVHGEDSGLAVEARTEVTRPCHEPGRLDKDVVDVAACELCGSKGCAPRR